MTIARPPGEWSQARNTRKNVLSNLNVMGRAMVIARLPSAARLRLRARQSLHSSPRSFPAPSNKSDRFRALMR